MLKIGISACFFHEDPKRPIFKGMTLQYIEQNVAHWLMQRDVLAFMVPSSEGRTKRSGSKATVDAYAQELDGRNSTGTVYWEGLAALHRADDAVRVGYGYLEMTGYAAPLRL